MIFPRSTPLCLLFASCLLFAALLCWINRDLLPEMPWLFSCGAFGLGLFLFTGWRLCRPASE